MTRRWRPWSSIWSGAWSPSSARGGSACARPGGCCRARAARGHEVDARWPASAPERLEALGALAAKAQRGREGPEALFVFYLYVIAQQVNDFPVVPRVAQ